MVSTMEDYLRFTTMLANKGELSGKRLLGKQTVAFMTTDHVGSRPGRPPGLGFGLGFEVPHRSGRGGAARFGRRIWLGPAMPARCSGSIRRSSSVAIYMVQVSDPHRVALRNQFRTMVQSAIIE